MGEHDELAIAGEALQRLAFEHARRSSREAVEDSPVEDEVAAVDQLRRVGRLLRETGDAAPVGAGAGGELPEARRLLHTGDGGELAVAAMERNERGDVDVSEAVAVGAEKEVAREVALDPLDAGAGHRVLTGVDEGDAPVLDVAAPVLDATGAELEGDIRVEQQVVGEVRLDVGALVAEAEHELAQAVRRVELHHVPEQWPAADLDHRLGAEFRLFAHARAEAATEQHDLHALASGNEGGRPVHAAGIGRARRDLRRLPHGRRDGQLPHDVGSGVGGRAARAARRPGRWPVRPD